MKTGFVIIHHCSEQFDPDSNDALIDCINSVYQYYTYPFSVYVIDNASTILPDLSKYDSRVQQLRIDNQNLRGITGAWNDGVKLAIQDNCDVIYLCNNDLVFDETINAFTSVLINDPNASAAIYGPVSNMPGWIANKQQRDKSQTENSVTRVDILCGFMYGFTRKAYDKFAQLDGSFIDEAKSKWSWQEGYIADRTVNVGVQLLVCNACWVYHKKRSNWRKAKEVEEKSRMNIVFMVNFPQPNRGLSYHYSVESWKRWAEKNNAQLMVLDSPIYPIDNIRPTWQRYYCVDLLENEGVEFDHLLMVDADTIVHPNCPNLFDLAGENYSAVLNYGSLTWVYHSIELYKDRAFKEFDVSLRHTEYVNGGLQIFHNRHKPFIRALKQFGEMNKELLNKIQRAYCLGTDQTPINYLRKLLGVELNMLDYKFNMQDLARKEILGDDMLFTKLGWVYHFNAIPQGMGTADYWVEKTYKHLYGGK